MRIGCSSLSRVYCAGVFTLVVGYEIGSGVSPPSSEGNLVAPAQATAATDNFAPRPVASWLEGQIALSRLGFSCGSIDGIWGPQSRAALQAFQRRELLPDTGQLDLVTRVRLVLTTPPLREFVLPEGVVAELQPLSPTWLGKSQQTSLGYETALEWAAEQSHAHPALIRQLNAQIVWENIQPGTRFTAPAVGRITGLTRAASLHVELGAHVLEACDDAGKVIAHFPVSIASRVDKRPEGELRVTVVIPRPDYTFAPETFPESAEGRELGRRLLIPPGPNNPVGVAWIGLNRPGYGIHGTPMPEKVGRTESHGCFRLANWDALTLLDLAWVGLPVLVDP